jgi:hypothetical protein
MVNQDSAHQLRRNSQELFPVFPLHLSLLKQPEIGLMHQRRRLQCVVTVLAAHVASG